MIAFRKLPLLLSMPLLLSSPHSLLAEPSWGKMPNVFRCVLDKKTRVLAVKLNDTTAIAYDTGKCHMIKIWQDKEGKLINLTGPVFNGQHGKQPLSIGETLVSEKATIFRYSSDARDSSIPRLQYRGHKIANGTPTLIYAYLDDQGNELAVIEETPSIKDNTVSRTFKVTVSDTEIGAKVIFYQADDQQWKINGKRLTKFDAKSGTKLTLSITK